tara:strand:- start:163 stop:480 length:318 start_codon:yes stop_codon:yes gene_type:complete
MKIIRNIFLIMFVSLFIYSCEGFKLKKKSASGEEFLIEKKDPLILPPDFSKLPKPKDDLDEKDNAEETIALDNVFSETNSNNTKEIDNGTSQGSDLKESIIEKIK